MLQFDDIKTYKDLYTFVINALKSAKGNKYIFVDEVQEISEWGKAIVSFQAESLGDIVIRGSNSQLLSNNLSTKIAGRYVEIVVYPLTFDEFLPFSGTGWHNEEELKRYLVNSESEPRITLVCICHPDTSPCVILSEVSISNSRMWLMVKDDSGGLRLFVVCK